MAYRPVVLVVLDGWGLAPPGPGNAVETARTPTFDTLTQRWPHGRLLTSGADVGLPAGQFGNSEVGHLNIGAGFVVVQDLARIDTAIEGGIFARNPVLCGALAAARDRGSALHIAGLVGDGGVHAHDRHLEALLAMAADAAVTTRIHAFTDGRDTAPQSALGFVRDLEATIAGLGSGPLVRIASVCGRYFAMDRDSRWDRTARAWAAIVDGQGERASSAAAAIEAAYQAGITDEFVPPTVIVGADGAPLGTVRDGDVVIMANYRSDRMRQLLAAFTEPGFDGFPRRMPADLHVVTMTAFRDGQRAAIAFPGVDVEQPLARVIAEAGLLQFHTAETEKYAHVTWFLNGGREAPFPGETRLLVPSPRVATYDQAPAMSAAEVAGGLVARLEGGHDAFAVVNFANADMVGHTGNMAATVAAVEAADAALGRVVLAALSAGGVAVVTADHGNAEQMIDPATGGPHTAHTTNPVPIVVAGAAEVQAVSDGRLADVAPTVLDLLGLAPAPAMTGRSLLVRGRLAGAVTGSQGIIRRSRATGEAPAGRLADGMDA